MLLMYRTIPVLSFLLLLLLYKTFFFLKTAVKIGAVPIGFSPTISKVIYSHSTLQSTFYIRNLAAAELDSFSNLFIRSLPQFSVISISTRNQNAPRVS